MTSTRAPRPLRAAPLPRERVLGLDGLRALAVGAVVAYHLDEAAFPGGFLGVDVFFVLSGYLITTLLLEERRADGFVDLGGFWRRRARRLLPPLLLVLVAVALATPVHFEDVAGRVRGGLFAAVAQVPNWYEALAGRSYFEDLGRPSPLRHLWSLGVEAQFYLLWPVVAVVALHRGGTRALVRVTAVLAAASFLLLAVVHDPGGDPSRAYYGTDTRVGTLLVGALLALAWPGTRLRRSISRRARTVVDAGGGVALAGLLVLGVTLEGSSPTPYRGGLLVAAILAALVVAAAVHPASRLGAALSWRPLVWVGTRSYAIYLWHWPIFVATRPGLDVDVHGWALLVLRLGLTVALAEASTRLVAVGLDASRHGGAAARRRLVLTPLVLLLVAMGVAARAPQASAPVFSVTPTTALAAPPVPATAAVAPSTTSAVPVVPFLPPETTTVPPPPVTAPPGLTPRTTAVRVMAVGESVLMAAAGDVQRALGDGVVVDADIARQPADVLHALEGRRGAGYLDGVLAVVVQLGSNGEVDGRALDRLAALVSGVPRVVAVTVHVDRPWAEPSNAALRDAAARYPWLRLADWHAAASQHPEWLASDGVHPNREGARQYAALVAAAVQGP